MILKSKYSHPVYKQLSQLNGQINQYTKEELIRNLSSLKLDTEGRKAVLVKRLKNFYKKTLLVVAGVQERCENSRMKVYFDYYVVIDFEATCELVRQEGFQ